MLTIRPFRWTDDDYAAMVVIDNAVFTAYKLGVEEWRHRDQARDPERLFRRHMIERDGQLVAFGFYEQQRDPQKFFFLVCVHPDQERPDVRPAYLAHVMAALAPFRPTALSSGTLDSNRHDVSFLEANGFRPGLREISSELDVQDFDASQFAGVLEQVQAAGIEIRPVSDLETQDPAWQVHLHELFWTLMEDVPSSEPVIRGSLADFEREMLSGPSYNPDSWFVALDGERYVGMSQARPNQEDPDQLYSGLTGVVRSHRRRGIAIALKLHVIDYARRAGRDHIVAFNEENNPMFLLNMRLGFQPRPAWVFYEKSLG